jgi:hypothetical protein
MENLNEKFYNQFIQEIKKTVPERGELPKVLSELLSIEKMSVYRRLKGDISFTFAEIIAIARHLNISLDSILNITSPYRSLPFYLHFQDYFNLDEIDYKMSRDYIEAIKAASMDPHSEFGSATNILPMHAYVNTESIFRFFMMKWIYQFGNANSVIHYSEIEVPERLCMHHKKFMEEVQNIKYTFFIRDDYALLNLIRDIRYFKAIHLLTQEDVDLLKEYLYETVNTVEKLAINETFDNGNKVDIFVSEIALETSYSYLASENINITMIDAFTMGAVTSLDAKVTEITKKCLHSIKRTSTIITGSEKNRIEFIEKQRRYIEEI